MFINRSIEDYQRFPPHHIPTPHISWKNKELFVVLSCFLSQNLPKLGYSLLCRSIMTIKYVQIWDTSPWCSNGITGLKCFRAQLCFLIRLHTISCGWKLWSLFAKYRHWCSRRAKDFQNVTKEIQVGKWKQNSDS